MVRRNEFFLDSRFRGNDEGESGNEERRSIGFYNPPALFAFSQERTQALALYEVWLKSAIADRLAL